MKKSKSAFLLIGIFGITIFSFGLLPNLYLKAKDQKIFGVVSEIKDMEYQTQKFLYADSSNARSVTDPEQLAKILSEGISKPAMNIPKSEPTADALLSSMNQELNQLIEDNIVPSSDYLIDKAPSPVLIMTGDGIQILVWSASYIDGSGNAITFIYHSSTKKITSLQYTYAKSLPEAFSLSSAQCLSYAAYWGAPIGFALNKIPCEIVNGNLLFKLEKIAQGYSISLCFAIDTF